MRRLSYGTDETIEADKGEEGVAVETMVDNPHDYLDKKQQKDGVPLDYPNSEHLSGAKLGDMLKHFGLQPTESGLSIEGVYAVFHSQEEANKCRDLFKEAGLGASAIEYDKAKGYKVQTQNKESNISNDGHDAKGSSLSSKVESTYHGHVITVIRTEDGFTYEIDEQPTDEAFNSYATALQEARRMIDSGKNLSKMSGEEEDLEPGAHPSLVHLVDHEGHSAGIHQTEHGHVVRGKGSAGHIQSEPITEKDHAIEYAKEMLKAHAKLTEREVVAKSTSMSEVDEHRMDWGSVAGKDKKAMWEGLTGGSKHKISACMNKVEGHVDNPGAYCKSLADEVGYKPE